MTGATENPGPNSLQLSPKSSSTACSTSISRGLSNPDAAAADGKWWSDRQHDQFHARFTTSGELGCAWRQAHRTAASKTSSRPCWRYIALGRVGDPKRSAPSSPAGSRMKNQWINARNIEVAGGSSPAPACVSWNNQEAPFLALHPGFLDENMTKAVVCPRRSRDTRAFSRSRSA